MIICKFNPQLIDRSLWFITDILLLAGQHNKFGYYAITYYLNNNKCRPNFNSCGFQLLYQASIKAEINVLT